MPNERPKGHKFMVPTRDGTASFVIPFDQMKVCPCGSELFNLYYRVGFIKPGDADAVGVQPACIRVEVCVCAKCGREILATDETIASRKAKAQVGADLLEGQ